MFGAIDRELIGICALPVDAELTLLAKRSFRRHYARRIGIHRNQAAERCSTALHRSFIRIDGAGHADPLQNDLSGWR